MAKGHGFGAHGVPEIKGFSVRWKICVNSQLRRAVVSIPSNIAEGSGRASNKDYAHFLSIARGSLYEVITQLEIAQSLGYIDEFDSCNELAQEVGRMLTSLMKKYDSIRSTTTTLNYN